MDAESIAVHAARALNTLTRYDNLVTQIGMCQCSPGCTNNLVQIIRIPVGDDESPPGLVAEGVGPEVWTALVYAHAQLEKAIQDDNERRSEIDALDELFKL